MTYSKKIVSKCVYKVIFSFFIVTFFGAAAAQNSAPLITPVIIDLLLNDTSESTFGAQGIGESERPTRSWLSVFNNITPAQLSGTLQDSIDSCPNNSSCVIEIDQLTLSKTVYINKSNIKLIGKENNNITFTGAGSIFLVEENTSNIVFENLNIDGRINGVETERDPDIFGIYLFGENIENVLILDNHIQYLDGKEGAHGIAALGTGGSESTAIKNLIIDGNQLNDLRTGFSESIVVNGNVTNWEIVNNSLTRVNNIAIDAIGGEGTSPTQTIDGRTFPGSVDAARLGFIQNNTLTQMSTLTNPAYGSRHTFAAGIYIDGARDIVISDNVITDTPWAFEIGAENCVETSNITLEDNQSTDSYFGDLLIGGYAENGYLANTGINCDPNSSQDDDEGHGYVNRITVKANNSFESIGFLNSLIELSNRILNTVIEHNNITPINVDGVVSGDENSIRTSE